MSGLPSGQFADYLIIAIIASIFGAFLDLFLRHRSIKLRTRFGALVSLMAAAALIAYFKVQVHSPPEAKIGTGGGLSPTATVSPTGTPPITPSPTPQPTPTRESYVDSFVRENVAPALGLRRKGQWAVVISEPGSHEDYPKLATAVSSLIAETGHSTVAIFRPSATHGTGFNALFETDPALSRRLREYCDQILLGKITSGVQENPIAPGLLKLTLTIDIKIVSTSTGDVLHQLQASAIGTGYDISEARSNAEESLATNLKSELRTAIKP